MRFLKTSHDPSGITKEDNQFDCPLFISNKQVFISYLYFPFKSFLRFDIYVSTPKRCTKQSCSDGDY